MAVLWVAMVGSVLIDDTPIHALSDQEAKKKMIPMASSPRLLPFNLINCNLYDCNRLYAIQTHAAGALP